MSRSPDHGAGGSGGPPLGENLHKVGEQFLPRPVSVKADECKVAPPFRGQTNMRRDRQVMLALSSGPKAGHYRMYEACKAQSTHVHGVLGEAARVRDNWAMNLVSKIRSDHSVQQDDDRMRTLFERFCAHGNAQHWMWADPDASDGGQGNNVVSLLDGKSGRGECGVYAGALVALAQHPDPLGLDLQTLVEVWLYAPQGGFLVDTQALASLRNLQGYVQCAPVTSPKGGFARWDNHKLVKQGPAGPFWDPCYGVMYDTEADFRRNVYPVWQPDESVSACPLCAAEFGFFTRRHHCRKCGRVVCDDCSLDRARIAQPAFLPGSTPDNGALLRSCNACRPQARTLPDLA